MDFIQQAYKGKNEAWMFWLTAFLVSGIFILNFVLYLFSDPSDMEAAYEMMKQIPANLSLFINLIPFAFLLGLLFVLVKFMHHRSIVSLTTSRTKIDWSRIVFSFSLIFILTVGSFLISYFTTPEDYILQFNAGKFSILLIISLVLFPFQIG